MTYRQFEILRIPFPSPAGAPRKTARRWCSRKQVLQYAGRHSVMAMITSAGNAPWPLDYSIADLRDAGLPAASVVRCKLFTLDHRLVLGKLGKLSARDQDGIRLVMTELFGWGK